MIARDPGDLETAAPRREQPQRTAKVEPVQPSLWRERRIGGDRAAPAGLAVRGATEAEAVRERRPEQRPPVVEVASHQHGGALGHPAELVRPAEQLDLLLALPGGEPQVDVENLQRPPVHLHAGVLTAAAYPALG